MEKLIEILNQRRVWSGIVATATVLFGWLGLDFVQDPNTLIDLLANFGVALAKVIEALGALVAGALALWSYIKPKEQK